jgi:hypothetical protein
MTKAPRVRCADLFDPVVRRKWWREHTGSHAATTSNHKYGTGSCTGPPGQGLLLHGPQVMLTCAARAEPGAIWAEATSNDNGYCGSHIRRFSVAMEHHPGASCN